MWKVGTPITSAANSFSRTPCIARPQRDRFRAMTARATTSRMARVRYRKLRSIIMSIGPASGRRIPVTPSGPPVSAVQLLSTTVTMTWKLIVTMAR